LCVTAKSQCATCASPQSRNAPLVRHRKVAMRHLCVTAKSQCATCASPQSLNAPLVRHRKVTMRHLCITAKSQCATCASPLRRSTNASPLSHYAPLMRPRSVGAGWWSVSDEPAINQQVASEPQRHSRRDIGGTPMSNLPVHNPPLGSEAFY
jgi:hypothetical protein